MPIMPSRCFSAMPQDAIQSLVRNRALIFNLAKREVAGRYRGSALGLAWSFFTPALMLVVYTFFFGFVFPGRWPRMSGSTPEFALILFSGLIVFNLFSECINRAPALVTGNANFVKRIVFPLEVMSWVSLASGLFHAMVSLGVWLAFYIAVVGLPHVEILLVPIALFPLLLLLLGLGWLLSSFGVFLRDVNQVIGPVTAALMFLSPVFYPLDTLKGTFYALVSASPLTFAIESTRNAMMWGQGIDWSNWFGHLLLAGALAALSFAWFQKTRKGFADVL